MLNVGIVANEPSGDMLGAALMREILRQRPETRFEGVGGPLMEAQGCRSLAPMERLTVMGLAEVLKHLPELLSIRRRLKRHFLAARPDVFIGVDAPDFNLGLETDLKRAGIPTVHYVSPTVWAWRPGRVKTIRAAADRVLSIFPFETAFLEQHGVDAVYVGHPLADRIPLQPDHEAAVQRLGIGTDHPLIALLPGSRKGEVERLAGPFIGAAQRVLRQRPEVRFVAPFINGATRALFAAELQRQAPDLPVTLMEGQTRDAMLAAEILLTASGTATLEGLLLKRPMVVAYRLSPFTHVILDRFKLVKTPHIAMANLLAGERIAPEFVQDAATPDVLAGALLRLLDDPHGRRAIQQRYQEIHRQLRRNAAERAAETVLKLVRERV